MTIFSWGYCGWGHCADRFVNVVDRVEVSRGFKPPFFVDIRIQRAGREVNFNGDTFRDIVGATRYKWMKKLGNAAVVHHTGGIQIKDPQEAKALLGLAIDESKKHNRRVIFYCACEFPYKCHRHIVADLLRKEAKKRKISLEVVEWPGGKVQHVKEKATDDMIRKMKKGQRNYPLPQNANLKKYGSLAWGSTVELSSGSEKFKFITGPIQSVNHRWTLPEVRKLHRYHY